MFKRRDCDKALCGWQVLANQDRFDNLTLCLWLQYAE